ncbi:MAG TPA: efflux RND transporter periplasmic adaptor subunit [Terriglobia bacterium]|nr:efflux RND transporter periplasmic adaptor subunit [Terriglobia bacterium]
MFSKEICLLSFALLVAQGCSNPEQTQAAGPLEVEVAPVEQRDVPIYGEWIAILDGMVNADIKAQVTGYLLRQVYTEGSFVRKGQPLFEIDQRPFQATVARAKGQLAQTQSQLFEASAGVEGAMANQGKTELDVKRYTPLAKAGAITAQELDNAVQADLAARAAVAAARAKVETAKAAIQAAEAAQATAELDLGFTRIVSPVDGVAGLARAQVGNLVSPSSDSLTTVSTVDPIKAYFTVSEQEYLNYVRTNPTESERKALERAIELELVLADGSVYGSKGRFYVADREVNVETGAIRLAGLFPNPGNILRPGQYGRIRAVKEIKTGALLVPQRAVTELQGAYQIAVVDGGNHVSTRTVKVGERIGSKWIIEEGLKAGEKVVVEGTQKVRPGMIVNPKPFK